MNTDPWVWRAEYADGTVLDEYDADVPGGRGWADVVAHDANLSRVVLVPQRAGLATHVALGTRGGRVRVFRRRTISVSPESGAEAGARPDPITVLALDWPDGRAAYTFLFADGSVLVSDELNAV